MTEEQVHEKVQNLLREGKLSMGKAKVIIPIPTRMLDDVQRARLYITHNLRKGAITGAQANGFKASLSEKNAHKILHESLPITDGGYCNLQHIEQTLKDSFGAFLSLENLFFLHGK